ncbi:MAG: S8 family serine peptidase [Nanoarchaeota archaeon]
MINKINLNKKMSEKRKIFFGIGIILFLIIGIFLVSSLGNNENNKVSDEVYSAFNGNSENVRVIITLKEPIQEKGFLIKSAKSLMAVQEEKNNVKENIIQEIGKENVKHVFDYSIAVEINENELNELNNNPNIESIVIDKKIHAFLQDSIPLINATGVWPLQVSGTNLTGIDETICIIDTGIDFTHPALIGKNKTCVIDCRNGCIANCSLGDDNGHGTHVAGIAAASGAINGVAIGANLIGVKVLDSTGSGSSSDAKSAIEWCVNNAGTYNISVISMSLGMVDESLNEIPYTNYCDNTYDGNPQLDFLTPINNATSKNISVIIATGNNLGTTGITSPACITNATAVGATTKLDSFIYNRNNLTDLVAPGGTLGGSGSCSPGSMDSNRICSTYNNGAYIAFSGTSMSTPHVAGAFALIRQLYRLQEGRVPTPSEIQNLLNSTGKQINDTGGTNLNFSRIDVYSAVNSILKRVAMSFISPQNNSFINLANQNKTFICNSTSTNSNLTNITFYLWNSTSNLIYNLTTNITGTSNQTNFSYNFTIENNYLWNCIAYNNNSFANSDSNRTITYDVTKPQINLISPANSTTWTSASTISFTYNVSDVSIANCSLIIDNTANETDSSVIINSTETISKSLSNANYNWSINCTDSAGNINNSEERKLIVSYTAPVDTGSPGGGGSSGGGASIKSMVYIPSISETFSGYTKQLSKDDKIKFTFFDKGAETHTLTINQIGNDYVNLTIQSNVLNLKLGIGQSAKLNLTNSDYYDLYVKLNSITANKADLTIQTISELISKTPTTTGKTIEEIEKDKEINQTQPISYKERFIYPIGLILIIIGIIILMSKKDKYTENTKKQYKQEFKKYIKPRHKLSS